MNSPAANPRILALDLRTKRLGFAVFEGPERLLDYGVRRYRRPGAVPAAELRRWLDELCGQWQPQVAVLENRKIPIAQEKLRRVIALVKREALLHGLTLRVLNSRTVARSIHPEGRVTKHEAACLLAVRFTQLTWKLPPKRRCWESENCRMSVFDAAAIGLAYFAATESLPAALAQQPAA